jgi:outer membrane lipoprotein carrier protein
LRVVCILATLAGVTAAPATGADPVASQKPTSKPNADQVADRVQRFYDKTKTFASPFEQRYFIPSHDKRKVTQGSVVFVKPGKMSWRYTTNANRVVADGKVVKVYEADSKQMLVEAMSQNEYPAALAFLLGSGHLKKSFKLKLLEDKGKTKNMFVLEGTPHKKSPAYEKLVMFVDTATYHVRKVVLVDAQRNTNTFEFRAPVVNRTVKPNEFKFDPPPGTRVIRR